MTTGSSTGREDATSAFFGDLSSRGSEPLLASVSGTMRFDLLAGKRIDHWYLTVREGDLVVSHDDAPADAVVRVDKALFDKMVTGRANVIAAILRGAVDIEGRDLSLLMTFQRLLPGPTGASMATPRQGDPDDE